MDQIGIEKVIVENFNIYNDVYIYYWNEKVDVQNTERRLGMLIHTRYNIHMWE